MPGAYALGVDGVNAKPLTREASALTPKGFGIDSVNAKHVRAGAEKGLGVRGEDSINFPSLREPEGVEKFINVFKNYLIFKFFLTLLLLESVLLHACKQN